MTQDIIELMNCPVPIMNHDTIQLGHGSGGKMSRALLENLFLPRFSNPILEDLGDQAQLELINGTVNDLAVGGAIPKYLSAGFIIEEGFPMEDLHRILLSMEKAAAEAGVSIVTGDTKVVNKGSADKLFINTTGIGLIVEGVELHPSQIRPGDKIICSGTIGDHGITILSSREGFALENPVETDSAALHGLIQSVLKEFPKAIRVMRDPTRGGVATSLNEFAQSAGQSIRIFGESLPVRKEVVSACELLGLDPLYVANEGKVLVVVDGGTADQILDLVQQHSLGNDAAIIGEVTSDGKGRVTQVTTLGAETIIDMLPGEQLPRIC